MPSWPTITDGTTQLRQILFDAIKSYIDGLSTLVFSNTGLKINDTNASHNLTISPGSDLTADRTLTVTTGDAARTLTISGNATVSQDTSTSGSPQFTGLTTTNSTSLATGSGTSVTIGGGGVQSELRLLESSLGGSNYTAFKAQAQASNITYMLPAADGSSSQVLSTDGSGTLAWVSNATSPGGSNTQVQFNDGGAFGGDAGLTYAKTTDVLTVTGGVVAQTLTVGLGASAVASNTALGVSALAANTTGSALVAVGNGALDANTTGSNNVAAGNDALGVNTTGSNNVACGHNALDANTTGSTTVAVGANALTSATTANNNVGIGYAALQLTTTGPNNVAVGYTALQANTSGDANVAVGNVTLNANTTGTNNTAIGYGALAANTTASNATAVGYSALFANTTGSDLVAVGRQALAANTTGSRNSAFGFFALAANTTANNNTAVGQIALQANTTGSENTACGRGALATTTTGSENTAVGYSALFSNTTGGSQAAVGYQALLSNTTGGFNVAFGRSALLSNTTGTTNTALGYSALSASTTYSNTTGLGHNTAVSGSNQVQLGDSATTTYAYGAVQNRSDERDKTQIRDTVLGLDFITALRPRDFKWDMRDDYTPAKPPDRVTDPQPVRSEDETDEQYAEALAAWQVEDDRHQAAYNQNHAAWLVAVDLSNVTHDGTHTRTRFHHGLIAQEVKAVMEASGMDFGGYQDHSLKGGQDVKSIGYEELIAPMIRAIQELKAEFDAYRASHP